MGLCLPELGSPLRAPTLWKYVRNARLTESNTDGTSRASYSEDGGSLHAHDDSCDGTLRFANQSCHGRTTVFIPGRSSHVAGLVSADHSIQVFPSRQRKRAYRHIPDGRCDSASILLQSSPACLLGSRRHLPSPPYGAYGYAIGPGIRFFGPSLIPAWIPMGAGCLPSASLTGTVASLALCLLFFQPPLGLPLQKAGTERRFCGQLTSEHVAHRRAGPLPGVAQQ